MTVAATSGKSVPEVRAGRRCLVVSASSRHVSATLMSRLRSCHASGISFKDLMELTRTQIKVDFYDDEFVPESKIVGREREHALAFEEGRGWVPLVSPGRPDPSNSQHQKEPYRRFSYRSNSFRH